MPVPLAPPRQHTALGHSKLVNNDLIPGIALWASGIFPSNVVDPDPARTIAASVDTTQGTRRSLLGSAQAGICRSMPSMSMLAMMDAILLLGELSPFVPRNFSFMAFDADDQELTV